MPDEDDKKDPEEAGISVELPEGPVNLQGDDANSEDTGIGESFPAGPGEKPHPSLSLEGEGAKPNPAISLFSKAKESFKKLTMTGENNNKKDDQLDTETLDSVVPSGVDAAVEGNKGELDAALEGDEDKGNNQQNKPQQKNIKTGDKKESELDLQTSVESFKSLRAADDHNIKQRMEMMTKKGGAEYLTAMGAKAKNSSIQNLASEYLKADKDMGQASQWKAATNNFFNNVKTAGQATAKTLTPAFNQASKFGKSLLELAKQGPKPEPQFDSIAKDKDKDKDKDKHDTSPSTPRRPSGP